MDSYVGGTYVCRIEVNQKASLGATKKGITAWRCWDKSFTQPTLYLQCEQAVNLTKYKWITYLANVSSKVNVIYISC